MPAHLIVPALLAIIAGAVTSAQPPTNAFLARATGSPVFAALLSFAVGTAVLIVLTLVTQPKVTLAPLRDLPWYAWAGGFYGAFFVAVGAYTAPRLGIASLITLAVAGQMIAALAIDHFGALGLDRTPVTPGRLLGVLLVLGGVIMVRRG